MSIYLPPRPTVAAPLPAMKAGPIGPGAGVLQTEFPLAMILGQGTPQARMKRNIQIARDAAWPEAAENVIGWAIAGQSWALETPDEIEIDDKTSNPLERAAWSILAKPQALVDTGQKYTRSDLIRMTSRHVGLCGSAFWFLDQFNPLGWPGAVLYIQPWRMSPNEDAAGNLLSWQLDKTPQSPGIKIELAEVIHFMLYPPDTGHFGRSTMEIALLKAQNDASFDRHVAQVLAAGGRLSGLLAPKQGILEEAQYNAVVADARTIVEQPDAAKRLQILRAPVDFTQTAMTIADLQIVELLKLYRDDTLGLIGVPSGLLVPTATGLNSGEARKYDKQVMWENAAHARVVMFEEGIQLNLIDRWLPSGVQLTFEIDEPSFGSDDARYDLLGKSINAPLRNRERRALVGLEPFGPDVLNPDTGVPVDDEVWLPGTQGMVFAAPEDRPAILPPAPVVQVVDPNTAASNAAGDTKQNPTAPSKASLHPSMRQLHDRLTSLRADLDTRVTPKVQQNVAQVLTDQRRELAARLRTAVPHLMTRPHDDRYLRALWDAPRWDRRMKEALAPSLTTMAETLDTHVRRALGAKAGPVGAVAYALERGSTRITALNERTREVVLTLIRGGIAEGIAEGKSPSEVADDLEAALRTVTLDNGQPAFDELRAETIARTELMAAYNNATLGSYETLGVEEVQAIDGDGDPECAARDGQTFTVAEANAIEDHPNGTLDWVPVVPLAKAALDPISELAAAVVQLATRELPTPVTNVYNPPVTVNSAPITVHPPVVNTPAVTVTSPAVHVTPSITLTTPPRTVRKDVKRDAGGNIQSVIETEE